MTQPEPPTEQQLDNITAKVAELRERLDRKNPWPSDNESYFVAEGWKNGTRNALDKLNPAGLVAEIRRLQDALTKEEQLHTSTIGDRDHFHDMADRLAYAVAPEEVIGEHSSMNDPWENALDLITPIAEVDRLRAALAAAVALHEKGEHNGLAICLHCAQQMYPPPETGIWSESAYPCATLQALGVGLTSGDTDDDL